MDFRIADTFTSSLARLTADEQKAAKTTAFDLQMNPAHPGLKLHRLDKAKDPNFWSVRVSGDIRLIVHKTAKDVLLCYVDHHDKAYSWAERRKLETHPKTGAAQMVVIHERHEEVVRHVYTEHAAPEIKKPTPFARLSDDELLGYGLPRESLAEVRGADEDSILDIAAQLPGEAAEALLTIATGGTPQPREVTVGVDPFEHPDAQRRFRVITDLEELERALNYPWEQWTTFLHPAQRTLIQKEFGGPARVAGSAGTGKTIVAIHRAAALARRNPAARILLTTFSGSLASALATKLGRLIGNEPRARERIDIESLDAVASRLYQRAIGPVRLLTQDQIRTAVEDAIARHPDNAFSPHFVLSEWNDVVDAWQLRTWEEYRDVERLGRKTRLPEKQRKLLWSIFEDLRRELSRNGAITKAEMYARLAAHYAGGGKSPYDFIVVDEAQDVSVPQLRLLAAMDGGRRDALFFAGDLGQRIFQLPFSWKSLGIDVRGRSGTLRVNYRTSHQIRMQADRLLDSQTSDVDGNVDTRTGTVSVFNGPKPVVREFEDERQEIQAVGEWLSQLTRVEVQPDEIGVFVRSDAQMPRAEAAVRAAGLNAIVLRDDVKSRRNHVSIGIMHLSKGLEFRSVVVMACDDEVLPLQSRIEAVADDSDLEEVYETERHLLYVACTRARDHLLVSGVKPVSEFLDDLEG